MFGWSGSGQDGARPVGGWAGSAVRGCRCGRGRRKQGRGRGQSRGQGGYVDEGRLRVGWWKARGQWRTASLSCVAGGRAAVHDHSCCAWDRPLSSGRGAEWRARRGRSGTPGGRPEAAVVAAAGAAVGAVALTAAAEELAAMALGCTLTADGRRNPPQTALPPQLPRRQPAAGWWQQVPSCLRWTAPPHFPLWESPLAPRCHTTNRLLALCWHGCPRSRSLPRFPCDRPPHPGHIVWKRAAQVQGRCSRKRQQPAPQGGQTQRAPPPSAQGSEVGQRRRLRVLLLLLLWAVC